MSSTISGAGWDTKDSGQRQEFSTGARRDVQDGKGRYDLQSPFASNRKAHIYERGARKYGDRNFEKGMPLSRFLDSAERHINDFKMGKTDEDHIGQAAWNLDALMHTQALIELGILPAELDDLPKYLEKAEGLLKEDEELIKLTKWAQALDIPIDEELALTPEEARALGSAPEIADDPHIAPILEYYGNTPHPGGA